MRGALRSGKPFLPIFSEVRPAEAPFQSWPAISRNVSAIMPT
ncbi:hypothetical protein X971_0962 [Agrobacterium tumefaciens LBA4213 (Ach5)]|nr:hypothetical protein X971_0962 [Agrobacterium tumefaciens LBA4213 (Ach5)]